MCVCLREREGGEAFMERSGSICVSAQAWCSRLWSMTRSTLLHWLYYNIYDRSEWLVRWLEHWAVVDLGSILIKSGAEIKVPTAQLLVTAHNMEPHIFSLMPSTPMLKVRNTGCHEVWMEYRPIFQIKPLGFHWILPGTSLCLQKENRK